jgi:hypothetical protein
MLGDFGKESGWRRMDGLGRGCFERRMRAGFFFFDGGRRLKIKMARNVVVDGGHLMGNGNRNKRKRRRERRGGGEETKEEDRLSLPFKKNKIVNQKKMQITRFSIGKNTKKYLYHKMKHNEKKGTEKRFLVWLLFSVCHSHI